MFLVILLWAAYAWFAYQIITHNIQIANFPTSTAILVISFFVLIFVSVKILITPSRKQREAVRRAAAAQYAANRATVATADSGTFTFRTAGTTFANDDGTSRQDILRHLKFGDPPYADDPDDLAVDLQEMSHDGQPAIAVLVNGYQVGFVPKNYIRQVQNALAHVSTCYVSDVRIIGGGTSDDGRRLCYGCEIALTF